MSVIKTTEYCYVCTESIVDRETTLRPSQSFEVPDDAIKIWSEYSKSIYMFRIPSNVSNRDTWTSYSKRGYIATVYFDRKRVYKIVMIIPKDDVSSIYVSEFLHSR